MTPYCSSRSFPHPGWAWPQGGRALLLSAALLPDQKEARSALDNWLERHDLDEIGFADHRLLAAIVERHGRSLTETAVFPRLKGLQRQLWTQSRLRVHEVLPALRALAVEGVELMLLKGAARIAVHPDAQRQRAHQDVDILVRGDQMRLAARVLTREGWQTVRGDTALAAVARSAATRAINFQKLPWGDIDLHRSAYHGGNYHHASDAALWERARPAEYFGLPVLVPEAAERLAITLSHGAWSPQSHSDWLVDAADILASDPIDWTHFADILSKRRIAGQVRIGLSYLHHLGLALPPEMQRFLTGRCAFSTLLIARAEADLPRWLRPVRRICHSLGRAREERSGKVDVPPLSLSMARALAANPSGEFAASVRIAKEGLIQAGEHLFCAELAVTAPLRRRRIELELNSEFENLARFRVFAAPSGSGKIRARISARIRVNVPAQDLQLILRPGKLLSPGASAEDIAKYAALPFQLTSQRLTMV